MPKEHLYVLGFELLHALDVTAQHFPDFTPGAPLPACQHSSLRPGHGESVQIEGIQIDLGLLQIIRHQVLPHHSLAIAEQFFLVVYQCLRQGRQQFLLAPEDTLLPLQQFSGPGGRQQGEGIRQIFLELAEALCIKFPIQQVKLFQLILFQGEIPPPYQRQGQAPLQLLVDVQIICHA